MKAKIKFAQGIKSISSTHSIIHGIKYIPVLCCILLTAHTAFLLAGIYEIFTVGLSAFLLLVLLILLSIKFDFCALHKAMIIYAALSDVCICLKLLGVWGDALFACRVIMFCLGLLLVVLALVKMKNDECCK